MIPCVSGKCILSPLTSRRFRPLPATAVLRLRWTNSSFGAVVFVLTLIPLLPRRVGRRLRRRFLLDLLEHARVADLFAPVGLDQPPAAGDVLGPPAARLVIGFRARHDHELRIFLPADLAAVLAARLELAAGRRRDEVRREAFDRQQLRLARLVQARDRAQQAPGVRVLWIGEELT